MTGHEVRAIRRRLGLTQAELARLLGYARGLRVSELERETNPLPVPHHIGLLMQAFDEGFRPKGWPKQEKRQ